MHPACKILDAMSETACHSGLFKNFRYAKNKLYKLVDPFKKMQHSCLLQVSIIQTIIVHDIKLPMLASYSTNRI
jgi:hypothetical protein